MSEVFLLQINYNKSLKYYVLWHMDLSTLASWFTKASKMEVTVFFNLISEVSSHHLCHILCIRNKPLDQLTRGGDYTGHEYREVGLSRSLFPQPVRREKSKVMIQSWCWRESGVSCAVPLRSLPVSVRLLVLKDF